MIDRFYAFSADGTGLQITTYDGTNTKARVIRLDFSADGSPASAMQWSIFTDSTLTAPVAGAQNPVAAHNDTFTNGFNPDTGTSVITAYIKGTCFDQGLTSGGIQRTPSAGAVGTMPTATTGVAGAVAVTSNNWLNSNGAWQHLQGFSGGYIQGANAPQATTAFDWYLDLLFFLGAGMTNGAYTMLLVLQYTFS